MLSPLLFKILFPKESKLSSEPIIWELLLESLLLAYIIVIFYVPSLSFLSLSYFSILSNFTIYPIVSYIACIIFSSSGKSSYKSNVNFIGVTKPNKVILNSYPSYL